ncbi:MAG: efflux RND transporter periplasmic adaptor subunit [Bacteroidetes bacterium]|jgi:membrane fusion protein, multidrug efflux system|nr:MAG: efflux RND transporter periplasmic adaptor subunit [Bacteroidota bacterium]
MKYLPFFVLLLLAACGQKEAPAGEQESDNSRIAVKTAPVTRQSIAAPIIASGLVASDEEARLSFKTGGVIQRLYVKEGDRVRKGQLLAALNLTEINAQVSQASEGVKKSERDLERVSNLYRDSVATLEQVQNATTALNVARQSQTIAQYNQGFSEIRAPRDGIILRKLMNEGEITGPGTPVFFLSAAGPSDWVVRAGLADKDWARLREGDPATISLDAFPGTTFQAKVSNLSQGADPMSGLYQVELKLSPAGKPFAAGLFATLSISPSGKQDLYSVPVDAIIEGNGSDAYVFVAEGDKALRRPVKVSFIQNNEALIYEGLSGVQSVITSGSAYLTDGSEILVKP